MTIGTGIAIAGVWVFAAAATYSRHITGTGTMLAVGIAFIITLALK